MKKKNMKNDFTEQIVLCACGCGRCVSPGRKFIWGHHRRGIKCSKETRQRMSKSMKGIQKHKGSKPERPLCLCGCGKKVARNSKYAAAHSPEVRKKRSELMKNNWKDVNFRSNIINSFQSEESRKRRSLSAKKYANTKKEKTRRSKLFKRKWADPKYRKRVINSLRTQLENPKVHENKSKSAIRRWSDPQFRKKMKQITTDPGYRENMRKAMCIRWKDPEYRKNVLNGIGEFPFRGITNPERKLKKILIDMFENTYKYTGDGTLWIGGMNPDFAATNGEHKLIEMFGNYWHSKKRTGLSKREHRKQRQEKFAKEGYICCVIWEKELNDVQKLRRKLNRFHMDP
ncbi:MAG: hypothetical protein WC265_05795 [Dysgonamonadaceae bacterium]|jgi:hypothetical protein